jgi:DNA-binding transcriptional ArsR family regulator
VSTNTLSLPSDWTAEPDPGAPVDATLEALLGRQRSTILRHLERPTTSGEIAEALWTVPGGATHHLRWLEAAGLVTRRRRGRYVLVERTPRGSALLALYEMP